MRPEIIELERLRRMPDETTVLREGLNEMVGNYEPLLGSIREPVTDEDARVLVNPFGAGPDSLFGLAWAVLHLVESAPRWPLADCLTYTESQWIPRLSRRVENSTTTLKSRSLAR
jgi:hypothetical protein